MNLKDWAIQIIEYRLKDDKKMAEGYPEITQKSPRRSANDALKMAGTAVSRWLS